MYKGILLTWLLLACLAGVTNGKDSTLVFNAGIGGNNTADLLKRADRDVLQRSPQLVVMMVGTNDMLNPGKRLTLPQYEANYRQLIARIGRQATLVLMTIPPVYGPYLLARHPAGSFGNAQEPAARVDSANALIRRLAAETGCLLIDLHRILSACGGAGTDKDCLFRNEANSGAPDGVHPTVNGYRVIAVAVYQAIRQLKPAAVVCFGDSITFGASMEGRGATQGNTYPAVLKRLLNAE